MTEDGVQLRQFVEKGDEKAFCALVGQHFNLVYGTALRIANGDASLAEDVAQVVFTDLARKAQLLPRDVMLTGWLYQATRFAAAKAVRGEQRRRVREQKAYSMHDLATEPVREWERLRPVLDAALARLNVTDRDAVLLHYFEQKNFRTVGAALGLSDDVAQKRVTRALGKLRAFLTRGGVTVTIPDLAEHLEASALSAAPVGLAASVAKSSLAGAAVLGSPGWGAAVWQNTALTKTALAVCLVVALVCGKALVAHGKRSLENKPFLALDLSAYANGRLEKSWTSAYDDNSLAGLGRGPRLFHEVPFEIQGVLQLQGGEWKRRGYNFPERIAGIHVGAVGRRIHILHANSAFDDPAGTVVAALVLHYSDGGQSRFVIRQGMELLDWWEWPLAPAKRPVASNTVVAWTGGNPAADQQGARIRLFDTTFSNPRPEQTIQSIDYVSAMAGSAPFLVALTIEH